MQVTILEHGIHVEITSFGYLHDPAPEADLIVDLRHHFRDPHVNPNMRFSTADDQPVVDAVLGTSGIRQLVSGLVTVATAMGAGPGDPPVTLAIGCAGGRHRAPVVARTVAAELSSGGFYVTTIHRDLHKPVVLR